MRSKSYLINLIQGLLSGVLYFVPMYADYVSAFIRPDAFNAVYPLFILISCMIGLVIQTWSGLFISLLSGLICTLLTIQSFVELNDPMIIMYYGAVSPLVAFLISCVGIWALAVLFYLLDGFQYSKRHKME
ncbi:MULTISPECIES: hypothetical protein [Exiguobacterium]|uniref:Uncharacterized protein n=1 Tax=Exiguobacterium sibiricum (strain DSM 17290 / CCUG 55495 / CIP 109462 / JCM 13490 / 255-15) TaxID=262543 RepID=B1YF11_EXIS2|nr:MULTISPECIES: hypothetical protein [Exiguobacterium]ACB62235.1 hypothetical protein Exig_2789 [Exiguobacterium sibiricum 255-15]MDX1259647.1 hypothetical protein [Exiguobacterium sp. K1]